MAISLTLFYGYPNAHNGCSSLVGFDCPRKPKIIRDCIKPVSRFSDRGPLPHFPGTMPCRSRPSHSLCVTAAMQLGVIDHIRSIGELVDAALMVAPIEPTGTAPDPARAVPGNGWKNLDPTTIECYRHLNLITDSLQRNSVVACLKSAPKTGTKEIGGGQGELDLQVEMILMELVWGFFRTAPLT